MRGIRRTSGALCGLLAIALAAACSHTQSSAPADRPADDPEEEISLGYVTESQSNSTASVGTLTGEDLTQVRAVRLEELLDLMPGVQVVPLPNGDYSVQVRGARSLMGNNEPLYVVDGVVRSAMGLLSATEGIAPGSVVRIDVLKDAGSLAMYGSRGANGVILITTNTNLKD